MTWVDWDNSDRLLGPIGYPALAEAEQRYLDTIEAFDNTA